MCNILCVAGQTSLILYYKTPIPQNDGACDLDALQPTYCKICEECPEEMKTSEDVNYHVMNNQTMKLNLCIRNMANCGLKKEDIASEKTRLSTRKFDFPPPSYQTPQGLRWFLSTTFI